MPPLLIAHRGATRYAPENSHEAVAKAVSLGFDGVEIDLRLTADGHGVCFHDDTSERLTEIDRKISDLTADELNQLVLQAPSSDQQAEIKGHVLFFPELLDITKGQTLLNIELKGTQWKDDKLQELVVAPLRERNMTDEVIISSFYQLNLRRLKRVAPEIRVGLLLHPRYRFGRLGWTAKWLNAYSIHCPYILITPRRFAIWKKAGYAVFAWTVNEVKLYRKLADLGVDGIITDEPELLAKEQDS